jgi:hypothetical protein
MKKAKIMLAVIAVLAIVGGTLAFRAKTGTHVFFAYGTKVVLGQTLTGCLIPYTLPLTTTTTTAGGVFLYYSTTVTDPNVLTIVPDYPCFTYTVTIP